MNEILTQLIAAAIDPAKIPGFERFDMAQRPKGEFEILLTDGSRICVNVDSVDPVPENPIAETTFP